MYYERHLRLISFLCTYLYQTFTKYVSSQYTLHICIYWHVRCQMWQLVMERFLILLRFRVFSYIFDDYSNLNCCISTKYHWLYIYNQYWYVKMPDLTASYGTPFDFIVLFWVFTYIINELSCLKYCIFIKLSQIVCLINVHIFECLHVKCDCWLTESFPIQFHFLGIFIYYYILETI